MNTKFHHLLVGVDFSPICGTALKTAARLAAAHQASLTIVHAIDPWVADEFKHAFNYTDEQLLADVDKKVRTFVEQTVPGASVEVVVRIGHPVVSMQEVGRERNADLLVMGTRGTDHGPNELGAVAAKTVRKAETDVLLVRSAHEGPFHKVTACVDFSETSARVVKIAAQVAHIDHATLSALHVSQSPMMLSLNYAGFLPEVPAEDRVVANEARFQLQEFVSKSLAEQTDTAELKPVPIVVEHVSIREAIVDYLKNKSADLLVLGSHGKSHIKDFLLGTAAETMVRNASCSVLVVKPKGL